MRKIPLVVHPLLFAIFPVLHLFVNNIQEASSLELLVWIAIVMAMVILMVWLLWLFIRNIKKSAIIVSVFIVLFFSYGYIVGALSALIPGGYLKHVLVMLFWIAILSWTAYFIIRTRRNLDTITKFLNIVALTIVLITVVNLGILHLNVGGAGDMVRRETRITATIKPNPLPSIYYIILDRYASNITIEEIYDYDNSELTSHLASEGFYLAAESIANYPRTELSLASSLNMKYINNLSEMKIEAADARARIMLQDYDVWHFLKEQGYEFIQVGSWWPPTAQNKYADRNVNSFQIPEFTRAFYGTTMLYPLTVDLFGLDSRKRNWELVNYQFDALTELPDDAKPTFIFCHILAPHPPYVFNRDGSFVTRWEELNRTEAENYVNELVYLNKRVETLIDTLISKSAVPPIIVLQSDEGPYPLRYIIQGNYFSWKQATPEELMQKMRILNAYYLPGIDMSALYSSITPVNTFRLVFNLYFGTNLEMLPDESYCNEDGEHRFKFFVVSDTVRSAK